MISLILFKIWALYCKFFKRILKTDEFLVKLRRPKAPIQNNVWRQSDNRVRFPSIENGNIAHAWPMSNWITLSSHYCQRFIFFGIVFKEIFGRKKSKDECSKTIKPISKFLSHIKCTWIKLRIHNTFTKFSKSLHIPFNDCGMGWFQVDFSRKGHMSRPWNWYSKEFRQIAIEMF